MVQVNTNAALASEVPAAAAAPKKAAAKKAEQKKTTPVKKAVKKAEQKAAGGGKKKEGLRSAQERILIALKKKDGLDRAQIAEKAPCDVANCVELIGSHDDAKRKANDAKHYPSLITLGYVKAEQHDVEGRNKIFYKLTANGRKAAEKLSK